MIPATVSIAIVGFTSLFTQACAAPPLTSSGVIKVSAEDVALKMCLALSKGYPDINCNRDIRVTNVTLAAIHTEFRDFTVLVDNKDNTTTSDKLPLSKSAVEACQLVASEKDKTGCAEAINLKKITVTTVDTGPQSITLVTSSNVNTNTSSVNKREWEGFKVLGEWALLFCKLVTPTKRGKETCKHRD